jgi:hypothetical protein
LVVAPGPLGWASARAGAPARAGEAGAVVSAPLGLKLESIYTVQLTVGTWAPLSVSVANRQRSPFQGEVVLTAPGPEATSGQVCYPNGAHTVCWAAANLNLPAPYSRIQLSFVTYELPVAVGPRSTRRFSLYVLAEEPGRVTAVLRLPTGGAVARAATELPVAGGATPPALAVVTDKATPLAPVAAWARSFGVGSPGTGSPGTGSPGTGSPGTGSPSSAEHPQVQYLLSSELPGEAGALGTFNAVLLDLSRRAASGYRLSRAQGRALLQYAEAGGAVIVVGTPPKGLPGALFPAAEKGRNARLSLAVLRRLLGPVNWQSHYAGLPSLPAGAPRAPGWGGRFPEGGGVATSGVVAGEELLSPAGPGASMLGYLEQSLGVSPPSQALVGLLLIGYVAFVGPISFLVVRLLRRRELAWLAVPSIAVAGAVALFVAGPGPVEGAMADQALVSQLSPGARVAEVTSLGVVYLPRGGSDTVELSPPFSSSGMVGDLGAGAGAQLVVRPGALGGPAKAGTGGPASAPGPAEELTVSGARGSLAGWVASGEAGLNGDISASASGGARPGSFISVSVANHLGLPLHDAEVVAASGLFVRSLGRLGPGATESFRARVPPSGGGKELYAFALPPEQRSASTLAAATSQSLYDLGSVSSAEYGGAPVLVAIVPKRLLPRAFYASNAELAGRTTDVVVAPLSVRSAGNGLPALGGGGGARPELALPARPLSPTRPLVRAAPGPVQALWAAGAMAAGAR